MSDVYKTGFALTMEGPLERQILSIATGFGLLDKKIAGTQSLINKLHLSKGLFNDLVKLKGEFGGISAAAVHGNQTIIASYAAMGGKLKSELAGIKGATTEAASVMNREMKNAFNGVSGEVASLTRQIGELKSQLRGLNTNGGGGRSIRHGGGGGHGGGGNGILDTIAMGPSHSGIYAARNIEHGLVGGLLEANGELQRQVNLYRLSGASAADVAAARSASFRSAALIPDVGVAEQMKLLRELSGATGDEAGARVVLPEAAKTMSLMGAVTGRKSEEDMKRLFKFIELRGVAINHDTHKIDAGKFGDELRYASKAMVAAQGLITSNDMLQFAKQAGPMAKGMSGEDLFTTMLAAMEDMGGARSGTSLTAVGRQFLGGIMTGGKAQRLKELGLLNAAGTETTDSGGIKITDPTQAIKGYDVLTGQGFGAFMDKVFRPQLAAKGISDPQKQNEELYRSVGTDTGRRLMGLFLSGKPQIDMVAERYRKAMGGAEGYDKIFGAGEDLQTSTKALHEAFGTLKTALGDAPAISQTMMTLAKGIASFADMVKDRPALGTTATLGGVGASAALLGYGSLKTITGFGLPAAATQLSAAAISLEAAAVKLGGGSLAKDAGKIAAGGLGAFGIGGIIAGGAVVGAGVGYLNADRMLKEHGASGVDPATGTTLDSNPMSDIGPKTPWLRDWIGSWFTSPAAKDEAAKIGKQSALSTADGFKGVDFAGVGTRTATITKTAFEAGGFDAAGAVAAAALLRGFLGSLGGGNSAVLSGGAGGLIQKASFGGGGFGGVAGASAGAVGPMPGIPSSIQMTAAERNTLGLIQKYESGGRNVMNFIGDRRHTAQGYFQITNTNWRRIAPLLGISAPNAMSASLEDQTRVAHHLLRHGGVQNWTNFNPRLRGALGRGEQAPEGRAAPPIAGPPPSKGQMVQVHTDLHVDGRKIARSVAHHMAEDARFPRKAGGMDTYGSWRPPGTPVLDAA